MSHEYFMLYTQQTILDVANVHAICLCRCQDVMKLQRFFGTRCLMIFVSSTITSECANVYMSAWPVSWF